jgi:tetratricopeptide (TPR) repeat protein
MKLNKLIAILFLFSSAFIKADNSGIVFDSANSAYAQGKYDDAIKMYEQILADNKESADVYFNLGNAYFKTNNIGLAILNYERAKTLDPDDEDILTNLKLANQRTEDKIEEAPQLFLAQWKNGITDILNEKEWSLFMISCIICSLLFFSLYVFVSGKGLKQLGFFSGSVFMIIAVFSFFMARNKYSSTVNSNSAVITSASVTITGSPSEKGTKLFILHEGTKIEIIEKDRDWAEIKIANGNVGWIKTTSMSEI